MLTSSAESLPVGAASSRKQDIAVHFAPWKGSTRVALAFSLLPGGRVTPTRTMQARGAAADSRRHRSAQRGCARSSSHAAGGKLTPGKGDGPCGTHGMTFQAEYTTEVGTSL